MKRKTRLMIKGIALSAVACGLMAVSVVALAGVPDYYIPSHEGVVTKAQVAIAVRKGYKGVNPKVKKVNSIGFPHCYAARFMYKGELKRVTFNCTLGRTVLSPTTR